MLDSNLQQTSPESQQSNDFLLQPNVAAQMHFDFFLVLVFHAVTLF